MLKAILIAALLAATSLVANESNNGNQSSPEIWECWKYYKDASPSLITAMRGRGSDAKIAVAGVTHYAYFSVQGFDRRWSFGDREGGGYRYSFIIEPDGSGAYYDFTSAKSAKPSQLYRCYLSP